MATKSKQTANTTEAYKAYLMEVIAALAIQDIQGGIIADPVLVAEKWGVSPVNAAADITKASNVLSAVKLFISKAVEDNWCEMSRQDYPLTNNGKDYIKNNNQ
jgi:hypothetical protein